MDFENIRNIHMFDMVQTHPFHINLDKTILLKKGLTKPARNYKSQLSLSKFLY